MTTLAPVDRLEIHILVDNATDSLSSVPKHVETEFSYLHRKGMRVLSGGCICCAIHGFSCLITAHRSGASRAVLFDAGSEADTFERNTRLLGIDLGGVEAIVLSHGHWDHGGAMLRAIDMIRSDGQTGDLPYYAHPGMFRTRGRQLPDGGVLPMEDVPSVADLTAHGARVVNTREPQSFLDDTFYLSGEIPRVTPFETGQPHHCVKMETGWELDPWIIDERWLGVNVAGKGLIVFTGCSHAGIVNCSKTRTPNRTACRCTACLAGCICRERPRKSFRKPSRRCVNSICPLSPPAIAPAGAQPRRWSVHSAKTS
jgi:7,8-dihydropterin-6-yl-methyl-4-(beta-D-ribofuranosyl)aminobenzene 5'-phosphate synthase